MTSIGWYVLFSLLGAAFVVCAIAEYLMSPEEDVCADCKERKCVIDELITTGIVRDIPESEKND